jgi:hypothetical protein
MKLSYYQRRVLEFLLGPWCKSAIDRMVEAGIFKDDDGSHIKPAVSRGGERDAANPRLEVSW